LFETPSDHIALLLCYARRQFWMSAPAVAVLTLEIIVEHAHSLKEKRHVVKSLKDRLRQRFNVSVAEIDGLDSWQRSVVAIAAVSNERTHVEQTLHTVEDYAAGILGSMLASSGMEWL
jgi:uncharacterized protein